MKKMIAAMAVAATVFAPQAFAQAKNFEGFSVGANLNLANSTTDITSTTFTGSASESAQNIGLQAQYAFALGSNFVLGVGGSLGIGDLKSGTFSGVGIKQKEMTSFYVAPGFAVSDTMQIYGKVASISAIAQVDTSTTKYSLSGVGYGLGLQTFISKNMFIQGEYMRNVYSDKSFVLNNEVDKYSSSVLSVGIGYKF